VLWEGDTVTDIGNLGGATWNTPMAINERGDVVGFASQPGDDPDNPQLGEITGRAFDPATGERPAFLATPAD